MHVLVQILSVILKVLYYICESVYRLFVSAEKKNVAGEIVLVTGAGRGIGRELAIGYASLGATVVCWDIDKEANEQTMNIITKTGGSAYAYQCDVSDRKDVFKVAEIVKKEVGDITILINNAGIGEFSTFLDHVPDNIVRIVDINFMAHYWTLKAFLPKMVEKNHGHIVALSSVFGLFGNNEVSTYSSTKFAIRGLMESLRLELYTHSNGNSLIKFTTIYPSLIVTRMTTALIERIKYNKLWQWKQLSPKDAALAIIDAQRQNIVEKSIPSLWLPIVTILRILPDKAFFCLHELIFSVPMCKTSM
ncbi:short-chain dehydrogenase/reductase family 16C member 6-like [Pseudomyrmex gracilis]|uniref:short-chain dehydrogenase/reductase family 16C member 6-like n=1 Tax=Pseudomyrmex gracilis TaxID=219809 RepID=UPI0009958807|nr:short-chain dehydrogenase/reductase family 16C member 6-like [Pseudomyrmex gracilis]